MGGKVKRKKKAPNMPVNRIVLIIRSPPNVSTENTHPNGVIKRNISQIIAMIFAVARIVCNWLISDGVIIVFISKCCTGRSINKSAFHPCNNVFCQLTHYYARVTK